KRDWSSDVCSSDLQRLQHTDVLWRIMFVHKLTYCKMFSLKSPAFFACYEMSLIIFERLFLDHLLTLVYLGLLYVQLRSTLSIVRLFYFSSYRLFIFEHFLK